MAGAFSVLGGSEEIEDGGLGSKGEAVGGASTRKIRKAKKGGAANKGVSVVAGLTVEVGEEAVVDGEGAAEAAAAAAATRQGDEREASGRAERKLCSLRALRLFSVFIVSLENTHEQADNRDT